MTESTVLLRMTTQLDAGEPSSWQAMIRFDGRQDRDAALAEFDDSVAKLRKLLAAELAPLEERVAASRRAGR